MTKTILLGTGNNFSNKTSKWLFVILGVLYVVYGYQKMDQVDRLIESRGFMIYGIVFVAYGFIIFSNNAFSPKVVINEKTIKFKPKFFGAATQIHWIDIRQIEFGSYEITFHLKDGDVRIPYHTNPDISIEIKKAIRPIAHNLSIDVIGG